MSKKIAIISLFSVAILSVTAVASLSLSLSLISKNNLTTITKLDLSTVLENHLSQSNFITDPNKETILNSLVFAESYQEVGVQKSFKENLVVENLTSTSCKVKNKPDSAIFNAGELAYSFTVGTSEGKQNLDSIINGYVFPDTLAQNFWDWDEDEVKKYLIHEYANKYGLLSENQLQIENLDYTSDEAIRQRTATFDLKPNDISNIYTGVKTTSFKFKPPLNKVLPTTTIKVSSSLYGVQTDEDILFSLQAANTDTCLTATELEENTEINISGNSFTIAPKANGEFLDEGSVNGTITDDYKRVPWNFLNTQQIENTNTYKILAPGLKREAFSPDPEKFDYDTLDLENAPGQDGKKIVQISDNAFKTNVGSETWTDSGSQRFMIPALGIIKTNVSRSDTPIGSLKYLRLPDGLQTVGSGVFRETYCFEEIYLPDWTATQIENILGWTTTNTGENILSTMGKVKSLRIPAGIPDITTNAAKKNSNGITFILTLNWWTHDLRNIVLGKPHDGLSQNYKIMNTYNKFQELIGQSVMSKSAATTKISPADAEKFSWVEIANWGYMKFTNTEYSSADSFVTQWCGQNRDMDVLDLDTNITDIHYAVMGLKEIWDYPSNYIYALILRANKVVIPWEISGGTWVRKDSVNEICKVYVPSTKLQEYKDSAYWTKNTIFSIDDLPEEYKDVTVTYTTV